MNEHLEQNEHPEQKWLNHTDKLYLLVAFFIVVVLVVVYYIVATKTSMATTENSAGTLWSISMKLGESLIIELIPVFLLFVCSYFLFRFYEQRRTKVRNDEIELAVIRGIKSGLGGQSGTSNEPSRKAQERNLFEAFWGTDSATRGIAMVYATRRLHKDKQDALESSFIPCEDGGNPQPEGVRSWLSYEDVRASTYLTQTLADFNVSISQILDTEEYRPAQQGCYIAIGLGFNGMTQRLEGLFDEKPFEIGCEESM